MIAQATTLGSEELVEQTAQRLLTLGQRTRIRIISQLQAHGQMQVQPLADELDTTPQNVSRHLALLYRHGIVERRQEGRTVRYWLADTAALGLIEHAADYVARDLRASGRPW